MGQLIATSFWVGAHLRAGVLLSLHLRPASHHGHHLLPILDLLCAFYLQGCWQLCLEELLSGSDATATTFLANGCGSLKKALGVEPLFLTPYSVDPTLYTQDGMQCIW